MVLQVLDARDPLGSRDRAVEKSVIQAGKRLVLLLNKIDLVPKENTQVNRFRTRSWNSLVQSPHDRNLSLLYSTLLGTMFQPEMNERILKIFSIDPSEPLYHR